MKKDYLEIGKIVNTHGIRGEVKIQPWCDDPEMFCDLESFLIGEKRYNIERARVHKNCVIAQLAEIKNIGEAELLRNKTITIPRDEFGELPSGTYFIADLCGLKVIDVDTDKKLGIVDEIIQTGSNDVFILKETGGKPILIPIIEDVLREVDIDGGEIRVKLLKGLID